MNGNMGRYTIITIALACLAGCSETAPEAGGGEPDPSVVGKAVVAEAIQAEMLPAIEQTFSARNASARLEGDVVHVRMDGDASGAMAGFSDCRVLTQLVRENESVVLEFPNGKIDCTELLGSP